MKLILINGKKRSGKDYFAELLAEELNNEGYSAEILSFADPIKDIIAQTFDISSEELDQFKNDAESIIVRNGGNQKIISNFRLILQRFGTEAMKEYFGEDVWVQLLLQRANEADVDFVLVPDFRFEIEAIDDGITVKIRNDEIEKNCTDNHRSENELNDFIFDYTIDNTGYKNITNDVQELVKQMV